MPTLEELAAMGEERKGWDSVVEVGAVPVSRTTAVDVSLLTKDGAAYIDLRLYYKDKKAGTGYKPTAKHVCFRADKWPEIRALCDGAAGRA